MSTETSRILAEQALAAEGNFPYEAKRPPGWVLDIIAEEKLMGGYSKKQNQQCPSCGLLKSNSGSCFCD